MRLFLALTLALAISLPAAERFQFNRVQPGGLSPIREDTIVITHGGSQTIPGPSAIAQFVASAEAGGLTNGLIIGWDYTEAPGTITFSNPTGPTNLGTFFSQGRYTIRVSSTNGVYYNDATFFVFVTDQGITNFLPTVELLRPPNGTTFVTPVNLVLLADALDKDGSVVNVTFYNGADAVGSVSSAPFQLILTNATPSNYVFSAVATDNRGATNISISHSVSVVAGVVQLVPPMVSILSPTNSTAFTGPVTLTVLASATDSDGTISSVVFTDNNVTNAVVTSPPYSASISPAEGTHTLRVIVTDNDGLQSIDAVTITIVGPPLPPIATLTGPANGATFTAPANVSITATASDPDGTVSWVRFFVNDVQVGTDASSPYSFTANNLGVGTYQIYAQSVDNSSSTGRSATNTITVNAPAGVPPSIALTSPTNSQVFVVGSTVTLTATATDDGSITNVSFYSITLEEPPEQELPSLVNDDGSSIVYTGSWTDSNSATGRNNSDEHYSQVAGATATFTFLGNEVSWFCTMFSNRGNADIYLDDVFQVTVDQYSATVLYKQELYSVTGLTNGTHTLKVVCKGTKQAASAGVFVDVDYFEFSAPKATVSPSETLIVSDVTAPYSQSWVPSAGSYMIRGQAWDNAGLISTSAPPVSITVNPLFPPFVQLTSPTNGQVFTVGATIPLAADASDQDGTVVNVNFRQYIPDLDISTDLSSPYTGSWTNVPAGDYSLVATATDSSGLVTFSSAVSIVIVSTNSVYVDAGPAQQARLSAYQPYYDSEYVVNANQFNATANTGWGESLYNIQTILESAVGMYEATLLTNYLNRSLLWTETLISKATIIDTDGKKNWRGIWASPHHATTNIAYLLEDIQGATGMMRAARVVLENPALRSVWGSRANAIYVHVRDHVVNKWWFTRSQSAYFQSKYNDPTSPQSDKELIMARLLLDLKICSSLLGNSDNTTYAYPSLVALAASGLKDYNGREARFTPWTSGSLVWSRGKQFGSYSYTIMDTSHAERLAAFVVDYYRSGTVIDQTILNGTCTLLSKVIWNQSTTDPRFVNFIDGGNGNFLTLVPWRAGKIHAAWCQLGEFDTNCLIAAQSMMRFIASGGSNPSTDFTDTFWGRSSLSGNLAKCVSATGPKPYAMLNGLITGAGVTGKTWTRINGPGTATIVTPTNAITAVLFGTNAVGVSTFRLTVLSGGPSVSDDVTTTLLTAPSF